MNAMFAMIVVLLILFFGGGSCRPEPDHVYPFKMDRLNAAFAALDEEEDREDPFLPPPPRIPGVQTGGGITRITVGAGLPTARQQVNTVFGLDTPDTDGGQIEVDETGAVDVGGNCIALFTS